MRKTIIISFLFLSACAKFQILHDPRSVHGVDPEIAPYVELYLRHKGAPLSYNISAGFVKSLPDDTAGLCTRWSEGWRQIEIDKEYWGYISENERRSLISHEMGHCDLNRDHDNEFLTNNAPKSLMYYINWGYPDYMESYYMSELFNPNTGATYYKSTNHKDTCVLDVE